MNELEQITGVPDAAPPSRSLHGDRGSVAAELALLTPVFLVLLLVAVALGRLVSARADVDEAAHQAARAASLANGPGGAGDAARETASAVLASTGRDCAGRSVDLDLSAFRPGGQVTVTVRCTTSLQDLGLPLPGSRTTAMTAVSPVDRYRDTRP